MESSFSLKINNPCSENWNEMTTMEQDRYCRNCSKTVVDFTKMSDSQIKEFFKTNTGHVCGRLHISQLHRKLTNPAYKAPWYTASLIRYAFGTLLTLKIADTFSNQPQNVKAEFSITENQNKTFPNNFTKELPPGKEIIIEGKVLGDHNNTLKNVSVILSETGQTLVTNGSGKFKFTLPKDFTGTSITLVFSHPEYRSTDYYLDLTSPSKILVVLMPVREYMMGDIMPEYKD